MLRQFQSFPVRLNRQFRRLSPGKFSSPLQAFRRQFLPQALILRNACHCLRHLSDIARVHQNRSLSRHLSHR